MNDNNTKLAKLIALAASDNDAETLTAIRRARDLLQTNGRDWRDLIAVIEAARLFEGVARVTPADVKRVEQNRDFAATD